MRFQARLAGACAALLAAACAAAPVEEVPFIGTPDNVTLAMLTLARVTPDDYLIDLGSGDGRIVITAAKRFGARGLGVEIVPDLVEKSRAAANQMGVGGRAHFREQDLMKTDLSPANVITMYLLPDVNLQLRPRLLQLRPGTRVVSHDWDMGDWEPDKTVTLDVPDKPVGRDKVSKVHLWIVPARVDGLWCGVGKAKGKQLAIAQSYQKFRAELTEAEGTRTFEGKIDANILRSKAGVTITAESTSLKATYTSGKYSALRNATFSRSRGPSCR
jgi:SAM-dependent methyltransferase